MQNEDSVIDQEEFEEEDKIYIHKRILRHYSTKPSISYGESLRIKFQYNAYSINLSNGA